MRFSILLRSIFILFCFIRTIDSGAAGIDCECLCCKIISEANCTAFDVGSIHLNLPTCDIGQCLNKCGDVDPSCEETGGEIQTLCSETPEPATTTATMTTTTTTSTSASTSSASPTSETQVTSVSTPSRGHSIQSLFQRADLIFFSVISIVLCS